MKLEELARQSSDAVRVSVSHLDLPPIGEQRRNRSWTTPILAAAAVAVVVAAGLVVVDQLNRGDSGVADDDVIPVPVEVPRLALPSDAGWNIAAAVTGAVNPRGSDLEVPTFTYYGTAGADDPFAAGDLLIASYGVPSGVEPVPSQDGTEVEVRGTIGTVASGVDTGLPTDAVSLEWIEPDTAGNAIEMILVSQRLDGDQLLAIAEALTIDPATAAISPGSELGLDRLAQTSGTPFDSFRSESEGYLIGYEGSASSDYLALSSGRGEIDREALVLRWWTPEVNPITVDGHPGYLTDAGTDLPGAGRSVIWAPADGIVANLTYFGADASLDVVSLAESVVELDEPSWQAVLDEFGGSLLGADGGDDFDEIYGESTGTSGGTAYGWVLGLQGDQLCFQVASDGASSGSCQARGQIVPPAGSAITIDNGFGDTFAHIVIVADPSVDDVVEVDGRYTIERVDADGVSWFVAIGDTTVQPSFRVIVGGEVIATLEAAVEVPAEEPAEVTPAGN